MTQYCGSTFVISPWASLPGRAISNFDLLSQMVIHPFSPPMFHETYSTPPYTSSSSQDSSRKRKRHSEQDLPLDVFIENDHVSKKQRDELIVAPLTPTSPPSSFISINRYSPPATDHDILSYNNIHNKKAPITHPPYVAQHQHHTKSHSLSDLDSAIPSQNLLLRNLHLNSRTYRLNQDRLRSEDQDEEMWEEEEEVVAERYSAMNKVLGSRKPVW